MARSSRRRVRHRATRATGSMCAVQSGCGSNAPERRHEPRAQGRRGRGPGQPYRRPRDGRGFLDAARNACASGCGDAVAEPVHLVAPIDPPVYRDFMAFEEHVVNAARAHGRPVPDVIYELPVSYMGAATAFLGPDDEVPWPAYTEHMDYELESGIVIARECRDLDPRRRMEHVLGLVVLNDFSARDIQMREMQAGLGPSKGKHFASAVGPWITMLESIGERGLAMEARVNGEVWSRGSTDSMMWSIGELVAWASAGETVVAGTLLARARSAAVVASSSADR